MDENCRYCGEEFAYYVNGEGPYYHIVGVEWRGVYDGALYWRCEFCAMAWQRWPEDHRLHSIAAPYIAEHNDEVRGNV
jgi:hypothetical protein